MTKGQVTHFTLMLSAILTEVRFPDAGFLKGVLISMFTMAVWMGCYHFLWGNYD